MKETRTYEITGTPIQLDILERIFGRMTFFGNAGMSRTISVFVDGDGSARVQVTRNGEKLNHDDIQHTDSDARFNTLPLGDVKADLG